MIGQLAPRIRRPATGSRSPVQVLLLHGMGGGPGGWDALDALLAPQLELWDVTLPWAITGDPDWAREPRARQWVAAPVEHIRVATGRDPDVVIAHSFAANVVLELLVESPAPAVGAAVLLAPFYRDSPSDFDWSAVVPGLERCYARAAAEIARRRGSRVDDVIVRRMLEFVGALPPVRFHETCQRAPQLDLETLAVPMLLVGGDRDEFGAGPGSVCALARRLPYATVKILDGCGHFAMTDCPGGLAGVIDSFIDSAVERQ